MPDIMQLMKNRHSVRSYTDEPIGASDCARLQEEIDAVNQIGNLHFQLIQDDPRAFTGFMAKYEGFRNTRNYIALVGPNSVRLDEQCGYFGEHLVLIAQGLGLNTCWSGLGFNRKKAAVEKREGDRLALAIAIGHGTTPGASEPTKSASELSNLTADSPDWFRRGIEAMLLAPTVLDEQQARFDLLDEKNKDGKRIVRAIAADKGHFAYVDYGIARYHFETLAGLENFAWG